MPRTARASVGGMCYHVLNRGNGRAEIFHKDGDYAAFLDLMVEANERLPVRVLGYVLLPNHFHLVLWPRGGGDLSRWMQWLLTSHVRRYHRHYKGSGHVWQGRFKAFPIEQDGTGKGDILLIHNVECPLFFFNDFTAATLSWKDYGSDADARYREKLFHSGEIRLAAPIGTTVIND